MGKPVLSTVLRCLWITDVPTSVLRQAKEMKRLQPLPEALQGRVFTRAWAHQHGVDEHRLYARDIRLLGRGLYEQLLRPGQHTDRSMLLSALCDRHRGVRVSHATAAEVWGLAIPNRLTSDQVIYLSAPQDLRLNLRGYQVVMHRPRMTDGETLRWRGVRLSHPLRVAVDLKDRLSVAELVILLDQLLRAPRSKGDHWAAREGLQTCLSEHRGAKGITGLREAVRLARVGAYSPAESRLRLAIVQGEHHFTPEQQVADQRRNAAFEAAGWTVILVNRVDARENFAGVVQRLRRVLDSVW